MSGAGAAGAVVVSTDRRRASLHVNGIVIQGFTCPLAGFEATAAEVCL